MFPFHSGFSNSAFDVIISDFVFVLLKRGWQGPKLLHSPKQQIKQLSWLNRLWHNAAASLLVSWNLSGGL